ncbi:uncharacterized protein BO97DRAFT_417672 [Aspergillus homomorphus CBS 101889]|uniref:Uncharacterized protein n=1 Tax=Aspergillus homomorphus (strain CBS 101889) TaxID=1450537 RepID=A0A395HKY1_ASPHC|nr:hypothetical protein BO97DRAFT_417672 [Aspergillus homomorphus CBS 101889]RAL08517.1 hypothetical protein BO97DRAFT_417672 [Aspergillus homomorphus CBS 101889]
MFERTKAFVVTKAAALLVELEAQLERHGKVRDAQKLRRKQHEWFPPPPKVWKAVHELISSENELIFRLQEEAFNRVLLDGCFTILTTDGFDQILDLVEVWDHVQEIIEELEHNHQVVWEAERKYLLQETSLPDGPLKRALRARRQQPGWHLSNWQRNQCARMGGCCARNCGCCSGPRNPEATVKHYGHCYSYCVCCNSATGYGGEPTELRLDPMHAAFDLRKGPRTSYERALLDAYFWDCAC